jgi:hypothetical protein
MKNLFFTALVASGCALTAIPAAAQNPNVYTLGGLNGGTNRVNATLTNSSLFTIACSDFEYAAFQFRAAADAATPGSGTAQLALFRSVDSTTYETTPWVIVPLAMNGTTAIQLNTNFIVAGHGVIKGELRNTNQVNLTNLAFKVRFSAMSVNDR